ncbi:MAG: U32 family peptidase [Firmicutes bacterium]|nr:U32 family peptidase [Bacillota bacterium]
MELLAPAGNFETLKVAVASGADSVYCGLNRYSARAKADNFTIETIKTAIEYAHSFGVKVFVALNTLLYQKELEDALALSKMLYEFGADALIVQDLGFASLLRTELPNFKLHASTQMGIHNSEGAVMAERLGFSRIILSRETTIEDIKEIRKNCNAELEFFCHGALCVAFSGNCYLSGIVARQSGNRGRCLQLCRKQYTLNGKKNHGTGFWLSAKDICMAHRLKQLSEAGISALKIEGRMRKPNYVSAVTNAYRKIINNNLTSSPKCDSQLSAVQLRGGGCEAHLFDASKSTICNIKSGHMGSCPAFGEKHNQNKNSESRIENCGVSSNKNPNLIKNQNSSVAKPEPPSLSPFCFQQHAFNFKHLIMVDSLKKFNLVKEGADSVIYAPFTYSKADIEKFISAVKLPVYLNLPNVARLNDIKKLKEILNSPLIKNVVANNLYALELAKNKNILLGTGLNLINNEIDAPRIMSLESKGAFKDSDIVYAFGMPAVMTFCHCINQTAKGSCKTCTNESFALTDETRAKFKIKRTKIANCYHNLYNNLAVNAVDLLKSKNAQNALLFDFCALDISDLNGYTLKTLNDLLPKYTKGHLYRGVI